MPKNRNFYFKIIIPWPVVILIACLIYGLCNGCSSSNPTTPITHPPFAISQFNKYEIKLPYNATISGKMHCYSQTIGYLPVDKCIGDRCYFETTTSDNKKQKLSMWPCKIFMLTPKEKINQDN